jgi:chitin disaccharide deacetylase
VNPFLKKMGYGPDDRVVVIHADDVGMCQSSLDAYADLLEFGVLSCGSVMVPCPWFPATAQWAKANPQADLGLHLTLTCEWDAYRWGPCSVHDPAAGLLDEEGYFPRSTRQVWERADPLAALREADAQIERALAWGLDLTHIDDHMLVWIEPRFRPLFTDLVIRRALPQHNLVLSEPEEGEGEWQRVERECALRAQAAGLPLFDAFGGLPLENPHGHPEIIRDFLQNAPRGGLSIFILHPALETPELKAIAPDWPGRVANYEALMCPDLRAWVKDQGIQVTGFRALRDALT